MLGLYPVADVRAAEGEILAATPPGSLMQRAAFGLAVECARLLREIRGSISGSTIAVLVGTGNNGGDALFAGAELQRRGASVRAYRVAEKCHEAGAQALRAAGGRVLDFSTSRDVFDDVDLILDGIVGIGAHGSLRGPALTAVQLANAADAIRVAVDVPSGVDADTGQLADAFKADLTVTFGCAKPGLFRMPGAAAAGAVRLVDIGLEPVLPDPRWRVLGLDDVVAHIPAPAVDAYKYSRGVVGIAAGSRRYPGAAQLAVGAARYSGVGMTMILDREDSVAETVVSVYPDVVMLGEDPRENRRVRAWLCGPGVTGDEQDAKLVEALLDCAVPVVLDAGAITVVAQTSTLRQRIHERFERGMTTVVTPHEGEYRLLFEDSSDPAGESGVIVVRKGPGTVIDSPAGGGFVDVAGTSSLACAGSGDVLAGLIAGLLAHRASDLTPAEAAEVVAAAVWLHGMSGRFSAVDDRPVVATDLVDAIPAVISGTRMGRLPC